jgi:hypothetical protein
MKVIVSYCPLAQFSLPVVFPVYCIGLKWKCWEFEDIFYYYKQNLWCSVSVDCRQLNSSNVAHKSIKQAAGDPSDKVVKLHTSNRREGRESHNCSPSLRQMLRK